MKGKGTVGHICSCQYLVASSQLFEQHIETSSSRHGHRFGIWATSSMDLSVTISFDHLNSIQILSRNIWGHLGQAYLSQADFQQSIYPTLPCKCVSSHLALLGSLAIATSLRS